MSDTARFRKGASVILRATREHMGRVEADPVLDGGEYWYRVRFVNRIENVVEEDLDEVDQNDNSIEQLATHGRWGHIEAFRTALTVERITNTNRNTVYAFKSQRILFEPYQYKPLLKILDSSDKRLLIADEVGLGKTIEAGLVLTELEARRPLDKVLVVCPSRLRDKWREELSRKFDQEFDILDRRALLDYVVRVRQNPRRSRLRAIVSMQTMRDQELLESIAADVGHLDVVIVDEAHHSRNPGTLTSAMLRELGHLADALLLLTATPLHLGSRDLFTLLAAIRPSEFRDHAVFDRELQHHRGVLRAALLIRARASKQFNEAIQELRDVFIRGTLSPQRDPLAVQAIEEMEAGKPADLRGWVELERRVEDLHPLAPVLTRTRKRDVQEQAPTRRAKVVQCHWTQDEDFTYQQLVQGAGNRGWINEHLSLGQLQRARQAASCLPAAIQRYSDLAVRSDDESVEITDILPSEAAVTVTEVPGTLTRPDLRLPRDSKFEKLRTILEQVWTEEPNAKVLIFTFFVGTSKYLERRLSAEGVPCLRISGDVPSNPHQPELDERGQRIRRFRTDLDIRVLVATEVGSEGLDFQFCHHLVNYDLPWNPMVVEQRIGRIDRFGQESKVVHIHNLVVEGTVEDRVLLRLYQRIQIFERSIGDLEAILGETVRELQRDYISGKLTPAEADQRVDQAARAITQRRLDFERLEQSAADLFGHEQFIHDEMDRVARLGRFVSSRAILAVIRTFLRAHHPGAGLWEDAPGVFAIRPTESLLRQLRRVAGGAAWPDHSQTEHVRFTTDGDVAFRRPEIELINVSHPLLRAAVQSLEPMLHDPNARLGQAVVELESDEDAALVAGLYFVLVFAHQIEGIRARKVLEPVAWSRTEQRIVDSETGERLLHLVIERGEEWAGASGLALPGSVWARMWAEVRVRNRRILGSEQRENEALYVRRKRVLDADHHYHRELIDGKLQTARERSREERVLRLFEAQLQKAESNYQTRLDELDRARKVTARLSEPLAACLVEIRRT
jgi:superfamily II DNA or RNA helicase